MITAPNAANTARRRIINPLFPSAPAIRPTAPKPHICHGVHGPCPKKKSETNPLSAPTRKPACGPRNAPAIIAIALTGLKLGVIKNIARPQTAIAVSTAIIITSPVFGLLLSNDTAKGTIAKIATAKLII